MNPSYFRIRLNMEEAVKRLCDWIGHECKEYIETEHLNAVSVSLNENGQWKGSCVYAYEHEGWSIFDDLMGGYSFIDVGQWIKFARNDELVFAAYNDATFYAEMVVIADGVVTKYFIEDFDMPECNINEGDGVANIHHWIDVAKFIDEDGYTYSEDEGVVLIF